MQIFFQEAAFYRKKTMNLKMMNLMKNHLFVLSFKDKFLLLNVLIFEIIKYIMNCI